MKKILHPGGLLYFITLPQILTFLFLADHFRGGNLLESRLLTAALAVEVLLNAAVLVCYFRWRKEEALPIQGVRVLLAAFTVIFSVGTAVLFKTITVQSRISPETVYLLTGSVTLVYLAVCSLAHEDTVFSIKKELLICLVMPVAVSALMTFDRYSFADMVLTLAVGLFCVFLYYFAKAMVSLCKARLENSRAGKEEEGDYSQKYRVLVLIAAGILPQAGLWLNNADVFFFGSGVFGDFSSPWFYIIALANGVAMLFKIRSGAGGLVLYYLKAAGFAYIAYFAIIFIPLMPYGLLGIFYYGLGLLILVPAVVFVAEGLQIAEGFKALRRRFGAGVLAAVSIAGLLTLPAALTADFMLDRANFSHALAYAGPGGDTQPPVNLRRLSRPLRHIKNTLTGGQGRGILNNGVSTPLLSPYYRMVALENKIVDMDTARRLERIFFGSVSQEPQSFSLPATSGFVIDRAVPETSYDGETGVYLTWVHLYVRNAAGGDLSEFQTEFTLPDGCFIKDYYLYVGEEKKSGLLTDKRPALITYESIIRTPKDPGILYYKGDGAIALRVYPFRAGETRKTGFLVMHSQNEVLSIGGNAVELKAAKPLEKPIDLEAVSFVPGGYKKRLEPLERPPQYCFIIDEGENSPYEEHVRKIREYMGKHRLDSARLYAASYRVRALSPEELDRPAQRREGGYNLALALNRVYADIGEEAFPVVIFVTDNPGRAVWPLENTGAVGYPESRYWYQLNYDLTLTPYAFDGERKEESIAGPYLEKALSYRGHAVGGSESAETVPTGDAAAGYTDNPYYNSFLLQRKTASSNTPGEQIGLVRDAFRQKLLTRYTAFIVLETREQEDALLTLQEKFLSGAHNDATPAVMMSEPDMAYLAVIALLLLAYSRLRGRRRPGAAAKPPPG